jgi:predicted nucleotidyltransferase component of viral defense system
VSALTSRQTVELFHLVFARALFAGLKDKSLLAIKGGINLRFYFDSMRFSEGLDLDVAKMAKGTLENRVDRLLESPALISPLKSRGVIVKDVAKPKQTNTTQRWKVGLSIPTTGLEERTKIEFSRRDELAASALDPVQASIANAYSIPTFLANHYRTTEAARQKIHALAERTEPQPRDVFDLHLLLARADAPKKLDAEATTWIARAIANATDLDYDAFTALVIAYLEPAHASIYSSREAWEAMQLDVVTKLEALA